MPLEAREHVRRMRGGAQAHLIRASNNQFYVVKFRNNPQHHRILVNELIASEFLKYLGFSAPEKAYIRVTAEFVQSHSQLAIQLGSQSIPVEPGWQFGSCYPGDPDKLAIYDFLPDVLLRQVANLDEFAGMLAFDKWIGNADGRQAVFFRAGRPAGPELPRPFFALMIDEGFVLNGPHWDFPDSPLQGLYHRPLVYEGIRGWDEFRPWLDRIVDFPEEVVDDAFKQVPEDWIEGERDALEDVLLKLLQRRSRVPDLLLDCRRARPSLFPNWC